MKNYQEIADVLNKYINKWKPQPKPKKTKFELLEELRVILNEYLTQKAENKDVEWIYSRLKKIIEDYGLYFTSNIIVCRHARKIMDELFEICKWYNDWRKEQLHRKIDEFIAIFTVNYEVNN